MLKMLIIDDENVIQKFLNEISEENIITTDKIVKSQKSNILKYKDITLNKEHYEILKDGEKINLTIKEFDILKLLLENKNKVISREKLLNCVWGYDYLGDEKIVNTHIRNIRKKLGDDIIATVRGVGYKI